MKKALVFTTVSIVLGMMFNNLGMYAQSVKTEHEIRFQNWVSPTNSISLMPSTATVGQFKLVLPPLVPTAGDFLVVGEVTDNVAGLAWREDDLVSTSGFVGDINSFIGTTNTAPLKFFTDNTERFRVTEAGKVLVNTETISDSVQFGVEGDVSITGDLVVDGNISATSYSIVPAGCLMQYAGATAPQGWIVCDGAEVSRTTYAILFSVIGTSYGAGDGSSTFNLPDLRGKVPVGASTSYTLASTGGEATHFLSAEEMPSHKHALKAYNNTGNTSIPTNAVLSKAGSTADFFQINPNVTMRESSIDLTGGGLSHNNMQPYLVVNYIIKY